MSTKEKQADAPVYTKQQFLESSQFIAQQKDVLNALLQNDVTYTMEQVKQKVEDFSRKVVV